MPLHQLSRDDADAALARADAIIAPDAFAPTDGAVRCDHHPTVRFADARASHE